MLFGFTIDDELNKVLQNVVCFEVFPHTIAVQSLALEAKGDKTVASTEGKLVALLEAL